MRPAFQVAPAVSTSMMHKKHKAIGLISGGLDSILAEKMVLEQDVEVIGVCFTSPFFDKSVHAIPIAEKSGIDLKIINFGYEYISLIKNPIHGYGKNINPCIDCHTYMLKQAKKLMEELNADFVFTGEVLNERPMSQHLNALKLIEKESGLTGKLLRPLSAQLLEPTIPETTGIIDRKRLSSISGRSRKSQIALAKMYGINDFPQPAGGCLLTDESFCKRLKDAFEHYEDSLNDLELLKIGRHFRMSDKDAAKIVVGRNEKENSGILSLKRDSDIILEPVEIVGPIVLIRRMVGQDFSLANLKVYPMTLQIAAELCARYSDKGNSNLVKIKVGDIIIDIEPINEKLINEMRI